MSLDPLETIVPGRLDRHMRRQFIIALIVLGATALIASVLAIIAVGQVIRPLQPGLIYEGKQLSGGELTLCPGDDLPMEIHVVVDTSPAMVEIVDSWWSIDGRYTEIFGVGRYSVITKPNEYTRIVTITIPGGIPPGGYEYRRAAYRLGTQVVAFAIPVQVKACP